MNTERRAAEQLEPGDQVRLWSQRWTVHTAETFPVAVGSTMVGGRITALILEHKKEKVVANLAVPSKMLIPMQ